MIALCIIADLKQVTAFYYFIVKFAIITLQVRISFGKIILATEVGFFTENATLHISAIIAHYMRLYNGTRYIVEGYCSYHRFRLSLCHAGRVTNGANDTYENMHEMRGQANLNVADWSGTVLMTGFDTVATTIAYSSQAVSETQDVSSLVVTMATKASSYLEDETPAARRRMFIIR